MIYLWGIMAGISAVGAETLYARSATFPWWSLILFQPIIAYGVFRMVHLSGNLVSAIVVFSMATLGLRIIASLLMGMTIDRGTWVAGGLLLLAQVARRTL